MSIANWSSPPERVRVHLFISGKVQGVFYRASAERVASGWGLTGWVRNLPDGRVELVAEGDRPQVEALILWCREGPPEAEVKAVDILWETPQQEPSQEASRAASIFQILR